MVDVVSAVIIIKTIAFDVMSRMKEIVNALRGDKDPPVNINMGDDRPPAAVVNFSQDTTRDVELSGYCVVAEIGVTKQLSLDQITNWSEGAAAILSRIKRLIGGKPLTVALSCPVAAAFMIGTLLGHSSEYHVLHWDGSEYIPLEAPDMNRFREAL